jgi:hypothetical protein
MPAAEMGYLEEYSQDTPRLEKIFRASLMVLVAVLLLGSLYYVFFRHWREEQRAKEFLSRLQAGQYEEAYTYWGCSVKEPCRFYPYEEFLADWGLDGPLGAVKSFELGRSYGQESGVIITLRINGKPQPNLWVEEESQIVGFSPY